MKARSLLLNAPLVAAFSLVTVSCGAKPTGLSPAESKLTAYWESLPPLTADQVFAPSAPSAQMNRPFTVQEFQQAAASGLAPQGTSSKLDADTVITLKNGNSMTLGELVNELNKLEPGFNKMGLSLRDLTASPMLVQETDLHLDPDRNPDPAAPALAPGASNFQTYTWTKSLGSDPSRVMVSLRSDAFANSGVNDVTSTLDTSVTVMMANQPIPLFQTSAQASLPVPLAALDRRYAQSTYGIVGNLTPGGLYAAPYLEAHNSAVLNQTFTSPQVDFGGLIGPIPVIVSLGVNGNAGVNSGADVYSSEARAFVGPNFTAQLFAGAQATLGIVSVGVEGLADLASVTPSLTSDVTVTENGTNPSALSWTYGLGMDVSSLGGEIDLTASVDLWILGGRQYRWAVVTWPGVQMPVFQTGQTQQVARAALNPIPQAVAHVDVIPSQSLGQAGDNTFGGPCPTGMVRTECRAYPEQNDGVSCAVPRWVSSDPTDCTCTFTVAQGPANQTQCGADVWAVTQ